MKPGMGVMGSWLPGLQIMLTSMITDEMFAELEAAVEETRNRMEQASRVGATEIFENTRHTHSALLTTIGVLRSRASAKRDADALRHVVAVK